MNPESHFLSGLRWIDLRQASDPRKSPQSVKERASDWKRHELPVLASPTRSPFRLVALVVFGLLGFFGFARDAHADQVDDYVKVQMEEHRIPGLALVIVQSNQPVKIGTYGLANVELHVPAKPESVFEIGSITKQFTAACILLLAQEGRLSVEDKVDRYLKNTPGTWANITIRHLLTHTSGLKSYDGLDTFALRHHLSQAQFIEAIGTYPLEFQPGARWKYCNTGYNLLGFIIENVSGTNYWNFLSERILHPLGMSSTTNRLPSQIIPNRVSGYEQADHVWVNRDYDVTDVFSAGAIVSTIGDLARWNASLDAATLLEERSRKQMWTATRLNDGSATKYGFGWRIEQLEGHPNIGHGGATSGFSASLQRFPEDHLAVIILTNTDEQIATTLARKIATFYFAR
jgi:D-alanyl-D-alanine carboxypeptidase